MGLLPRRGRDVIGRALKADKVLDERDDAARRAYEVRASNSEPGLESAGPDNTLTQAAGA